MIKHDIAAAEAKRLRCIEAMSSRDCEPFWTQIESLHKAYRHKLDECRREPQTNETVIFQILEGMFLCDKIFAWKKVEKTLAPDTVSGV